MQHEHEGSGTGEALDQPRRQGGDEKQARSVGLRALGVLGGIVVWVVVWLSLTLLIAGIGIRVFFGKISIDQLLLNLVSIQTDGGGSTLVWLAIICIGGLPIVLTVIAAIIVERRRRRTRAAGLDTPVRKRGFAGVSAVLCVALAAGGTWTFASTVSLRDYIESGKIDADIGDYYVVPEVTDDAHKRNLVIVYLESGEATLGDAKTFEKDMLQPLKRETTEWARIDDYRQYAGGGWTMAGIVSTQCGIPLKGKSAASGNEIVDELLTGLDSYLPNATCLGDVLAEHGYRSMFIGGANPGFAAKGTFLSNHGYSEELGIEDWRAAGESEDDMRPDWGLSDARLMAHAKTIVTQLHDEAERTGEPFNLSMLTLDTHEPAHVYDSCDVDTEEKMTSIYACSMGEVAGFIDYMRDQGYLEDTAVVVMGDHLKQLGINSAFREQLDGRDDRYIFNRLWVPGAESRASEAPQLREGADQLSMYPTILEAAGLQLRDHEAGLGVSAFTDEIPAGSALSLSESDYHELLHARSDDFYVGAWKD